MLRAAESVIMIMVFLCALRLGAGRRSDERAVQPPARLSSRQLSRRFQGGAVIWK